jgi:hypothetical protein
MEVPVSLDNHHFFNPNTSENNTNEKKLGEKIKMLPQQYLF